MEAAVRAFEDWEFSILESESRLEEEEEEVEEEEADEEEEDAGGDLSVQQQQAISYGQVPSHPVYTAIRVGETGRAWTVVTETGR